jgi:hypothetical protein
MSDVWPAADAYFQAAINGAAIEAGACFGKSGPNGEEYWSATGRMYPMKAGIGLEGDLNHPALYPGWYTPIHLRISFDPDERRGMLDIKMTKFGDTRQFSDAQSVGKGYVQQWYNLTDITSVHLEIWTPPWFAPVWLAQTEAYRVARKP